ncbi:non-ribosomal peptide synthetase [Streptomyces xylophagus]|uniref:non-ribosomal peptide synthetase n=1 Tax=Streptomyces xylophagus TaxID=285514 RepID=UPI00068C4B16|nr:amino acid adenylation domain-containing protein [Streptomyces xylophagus]
MSSTPTPTVSRHIVTAQQAERRPDAPPAELSLRLFSAPDADAVSRAVQRVVAAHETLRARIVPAAEGHDDVVSEVREQAELVWRTPEGNAPDGSLNGDVEGLPLRVEFRPGRADEPGALTLSLPSRAVDEAGLAALGAHLLALLTGEAPPEPVQSSQYAAWQYETRAAAEPEDRAVGVLPERLPSPLSDVGRDTDAGASGAEGPRRIGVVVDGALGGRIRSLSEELGTDPGAVVLGAWLVCLWRHNADRDFVSGVCSDQRRRYPELADTVGVLATHLPLAFGVTDTDTTASLVARLSGQLAQLLAATDLFSWDDVRPGGYDCDSRAPRRPVLFTDLPFDSDTVVAAVTPTDPSLSPRLALQVLRGLGSTRLELLHDAGFDRARAAALLDGVVTLLDGMTGAPHTPVTELALLSPEATAQVLAQYGHAPEDLRRDHDDSPEDTQLPNAYDLFARQARRTPDRVAVQAGDTAHSYAELDRHATAVAASLARRGLRPGDRVGLLLDRGVGMVAAVLGAWRAGLAYVPVDPATPADRVALLLADSGAALLVTEAALRHLTPAAGPPAAELRELLAETATDTDLPERDPSDPAYVIYTSGTTGRPKGVMIEQRSVVAFAHAHRERIYRHHAPSDGGLRVSFNASLAFDGSVERILTLLHGAGLYIFDDAARRDPDLFLAQTRRHRLHVLDVTPTFLTLLVQRGLLDHPEHRPDVVLVGGEAIGPALWRQLTDSAIAFYNVYGPTEATVNAAVGPVTGVEPHLGRALPGARLYILDNRLRPVPVGVVGEIHISGAGLARGYLGRDDLTASAFVPSPFAAGDSAHGRLYRTGDRGRFRPDGGVEFLGRGDGQVKLRGYRIETAEISTVLALEPGVDEALVRLHTSAAGEPSLVAYVVADPAPADLLPRLRDRLAKALPDYMVPGEIIILARLPLTVNGKVDTAALPAPGTVRQATLSTEYVEPAGELETFIAGIWSEVLGITGIGSRDNFFELGGHSLLAASMIARVNETFGVELSLATAFARRTVTGLAVAVAQELTGARTPEELAAILAGTDTGTIEEN